MKILHTADIQLGAQFKGLREQAKSQREEIKKAFHTALELGVREGVGVVLISGDLFDKNNPPYDLVEFVKGEFSYLLERRVEVCIVPGHHDALEAQGIYNREKFDNEFSNVFIFRNPEGEVKEYAALNLAIFAKPNLQTPSIESPFPDFGRLTSDMQYNIVAAHGDLQIPGNSAKDYHPIALGEIEALKGIDYVALGHWHSMKDCSKFGSFSMPVWYSGAPELTKVDQESRHVLLVELGEGGVDVKPIEVGKRRVARVSLDIAGFEAPEELRKKLSEQAGKDTILEAEISGLNIHNILIDADRLEEDLQESFFFVRIRDTSHTALKDLPEYPESMIHGQFVKIMQKKMKGAADAEKKIYEDALRLGLMELEGKEVL